MYDANSFRNFVKVCKGAAIAEHLFASRT